MAARPGREGRAQEASRCGSAIEEGRESAGECRDLVAMDDLGFDGAETGGNWESERQMQQKRANLGRSHGYKLAAERGVKGFVCAVERDGGAIASSIAVIEFGPDLL